MPQNKPSKPVKAKAIIKVLWISSKPPWEFDIRVVSTGRFNKAELAKLLGETVNMTLERAK